jgi:hypothetical protein
MKEFKIVTETVTPGYNDENGVFIKTGNPKEKINIIYYENEIETKEYFGPDGVVRYGYTEKIN